MSDTITVTGFFGKPKLIGRDEFVRRWTATVDELTNLAGTTDEMHTIEAFKEQIAGMARRKFDLVLNVQRRTG